MIRPPRPATIVLQIQSLDRFLRTHSRSLVLFSYDTYLPSFEAPVVQADAKGYMCSENKSRDLM